MLKTNIKVFVRVRPFQQGEDSLIQLVNIDKQNNKVILNESINLLQYNFDEVFDTDSKQIEIFEHFVPSIKQLFLGYNMTIFAYGQTGSGKTYTMFGQDWESLYDIPKNNNYQQQTYFQDIQGDQNYAGVIPRIIYEIYKQSKEHHKIYCSFLQIYNEKIFDLLSQQNESNFLEIHETVYDGIFVEGLSEYEVSDYNSALILMQRGEKFRKIRQTALNNKSSRSHTIFQITIESSIPDADGNLVKSKINLCDLAGSEKLDKNENIQAGHFKELKNINLSLTTLGKVIQALSNKQKLPVPYRESKLTRLLQSSLGGSTNTFVITNLSPSQSSYNETCSTLKFAERAQQIRLKVTPNNINAQDQKTVQRLQQEIIYLKNLLNMKRKTTELSDVHVQLFQLKEENSKLKQQTNKEKITELINENRRIKNELTKFKEQDYITDNNDQMSDLSVPFRNSMASRQSVNTDNNTKVQINQQNQL